MLDSFETLFERVLKFNPLVPWLVLIIYGTGFFLWNSYLLKFGFFEYNLIQLRYFSAGLLFWVPPLSLFLLFRRHLSYPTNVIFIFLITLWFFGFQILTFPQTPQNWGGARPFAISLIGEPDQIGFLVNFGISSAENADKHSVQTDPVCFIYQNDDYALIFKATQRPSLDSTSTPLAVRVLSLPRSAFSGFHSKLDWHSSLECNWARPFYGNPLVRLYE